MLDPKEIIKLMEERGEIVQLEDGYYHYIQAYDSNGSLSAADLRIIADYLDDENAVWDEICKFAGNPDRLPSMMWQAGLQLIDEMIVKLVEAGFEIQGGDDGGDEVLKFTTRKAAIEMVASVDSSSLFFTREGRRSVVAVIPGNGEDAILDHSCGDPAFVAAMAAADCSSVPTPKRRDDHAAEEGA